MPTESESHTSTQNEGLYAGYKALSVQREGRVLRITMIHGPGGTMRLDVHEELSRIFFDVNRDNDVSVVIFTGADETFSTGASVERMLDRASSHNHASWRKVNNEARELVRGMLQLERPLIARVNGDALGLGATLVAFADFAYMLHDRTIADTHVRMGLTAGDGGALMWPFLVGFPRAKRYLMTGAPLSGRQAAEIGLITGSVGTMEELDREVDAMAQELLSLSPLAVGSTKAAINLLLRRVTEGVLEAHLGWWETRTYLTSDHQETLRAILDERDPNYIGD